MEQKKVEEREGNKEEKRSINWGQLIICTLWFIGTGIILVSHLTDSLGSSFTVPRIIGWLYELVGILPASIIQLVIMALGIYTSFPKKK